MAKVYTINCPICGLEISTQDPDFNDHVEMVMMVD